MKVLAWLFAPMLAIALGVPIGAVAITATVVAPAVAEQIRIDPCSAYPDQVNLPVPGGEEDGDGDADYGAEQGFDAEVEIG